MVFVAMPKVYAYETVRQIDNAVTKLEKYAAFHSNKVKQAQIMRRVILEKKRTMLITQARRAVKNASAKGQKKEEKPKGKGRPRKFEGRCTACINRYLKVKGGGGHLTAKNGGVPAGAGYIFRDNLEGAQCSSDTPETELPASSVAASRPQQPEEDGGTSIW